MTTYTIDTENAITAFATAEEAAATTTTPFDTFASEKELAELATAWPAARLVTIWNSLPGVVALKKLPETKAAKEGWAKQIWERIEKMGAPETVAVEQPQQAKADKKAKGGAQSAKSAPAKGKASKKATPAKPAPTGKKATKAQAVAAAPRDAKGKKAGKTEAAAPREGSKMSQVIAMLQRKNGATITEIMKSMSWQKHTVRGFMAGAMKKAGYTVESFKPEGGERTYRINK